VHDHRLRSWAQSNEHWLRSLDEESHAPLLPQLQRLLYRHRSWLVRSADLQRCHALVAMAGGAAEKARWAALLSLVLEVGIGGDGRVEVTSGDGRVEVTSGDGRRLTTCGKRGLREIGSTADMAAKDGMVVEGGDGGTLAHRADADGPVQSSPVETSPVQSSQVKSSQAHEAATDGSGGARGGGRTLLSALHASLGSMSEAHRQLACDTAHAGALLCTANARLVRRLPDHVHLRTYVHQTRWLVGDAIALCEQERQQLEANPASVLLCPQDEL